MSSPSKYELGPNKEALRLADRWVSPPFRAPLASGIMASAALFFV